MSEIVIPKNLKNKLPDGSFVHELIKNVKAFLKKTPYFPEYTMHDEDHICAVLKLADELIPPTTLDKLNGQSVEILIGAIILHDLGMFIERAGLKRLLFGEHKERCEKYLDKLTWNEAWRDFYNKAQRYTDRQLIHIFGNPSPIGKLPFDDVPEGNYLLYGEFLRKNHARLAFDITQIGFPSNNTDQDVFEKCNCHEYTKTCIGIVARSHCMKKLRDAEKFLNNYPYTPKDIPLYYLMAVLRIADILHIGQDRAPKFTELKDKINSPESQRQFHLNQAILEGPSFFIKQKSIYINAAPKCSSTYVDVENLLYDIQQELDYCWAVLAEEYSYEYELSVHRIMSNLFDENKVAALNNHFLTSRTTLDANPDIVKLLIEPLYGNNPSYGVRELIQNAVDACNERTFLDNKIVGEIVINVNTKEKTFEISDNGIGMNHDVLKNYFLVAGSSYRRSDVWRNKYIDDDGKAKFARSGHFGIGALAGFLIGDEIAVITRHKDDELGYQFIYTMEPKTLDITRINAEIGTKLVIQMHEEALEYFSRYTNIADSELIEYGKKDNVQPWYHWYLFSTPKIIYFIDKKQIEKNKFIIPDKGIEKNGWYDVKSNVCSNIKLNFNKKYQGDLIVNGIIIKIGHHISFNNIAPSIDTMPGISVVDSDNILNMNLSRTKIFDFPQTLVMEILEEIFKYYLARLLTFDSTSPHKFFHKRLAISTKGFTIFEPLFVYHTKEKKAICLFTENFFEPLSNTPIAIFEPDDDYCDDSLLLDDDDSIISFSEDLKFNIESGYISDSCINFWHNFSHNCKLSLSKRCNNGQPPFGLKLSKKLKLIIEYAPTKPYKAEDYLMLKVLHEYLPADVNDGFIPFEMDKRKELYSKAFSELKRYM